jgi:hypothetical protein
VVSLSLGVPPHPKWGDVAELCTHKRPAEVVGSGETPFANRAFADIIGHRNHSGLGDPESIKQGRGPHQ